MSLSQGWMFASRDASSGDSAGQPTAHREDVTTRCCGCMGTLCFTSGSRLCSSRPGRLTYMDYMGGGGPLASSSLPRFGHWRTHRTGEKGRGAQSGVSPVGFLLVESPQVVPKPNLNSCEATSPHSPPVPELPYRLPTAAFSGLGEVRSPLLAP